LHAVEDGIDHCQNLKPEPDDEPTEKKTSTESTESTEIVEIKGSKEIKSMLLFHAWLIQYGLMNGQDDGGFAADIPCFTNSRPDFYQSLNMKLMKRVPYSVFEIKYKADERYATDAQRLEIAQRVELVHLTKKSEKVKAENKTSDWCVHYVGCDVQ
jgi:hypothetical protein